jgi:16S rRNA (uracil1498-N3)-methyltransferase
MGRYDFKAPRLFCDGELAPGRLVACDAEQGNYLRNVLRLARGDAILIFNGRDGEWRARIEETAKSQTTLRLEAQIRAQQMGPDLDYLFAPLKRARLDYMVQKATEMGVARLRPVFTRRTTPERINIARMKANAIEAAEQCGILRVPQVEEPAKLQPLIAGWDRQRRLIFCDEENESPDPIAALARLEPGPLALLIGPEGGFEDGERELIASQSFALSISLGPRILRADTAAVAALALVNATLGDWR